MKTNPTPQRPALDPSRVRDALEMHVERMGKDTFRILETSGEEEYVEVRPYLTCHCHDALFRDALCAHMIASLLAEGDPEAISMARDLGRQETEDRGDADSR